ncbi:MAG TPA: glycosyltransferase [Gemmatimonadales bacterium]|jgi:glycosyltransferase involved in cell wall biosynthesis|nr:glycosyltransferase [Gemmatimonadales bacterium]
MRVLQVDSGREWRGGQNQVRLLCRELGRGPAIEQVLVTKTGSELARRAAADGTNVQGTAWEIGLDPRAWWHLRRTIAAFQPDIIHVHDSHALTLAATVALGRTLVATRRVDFHVGRFGAWRRPDRIIAVSDAVKQMLIGDGIAADAITVVPDGIDPEEIRRASTPALDIRSQLRISAKASLAVNAAALVDHKDQRTLVRAARYARELEPQLHWIIAGEGPMRASLTAEIARLELQGRVQLVGHVDRVEALIAEASVFVMSSKQEGLGSVILNALALDRPVVATAAGGIPEILPPEVLVPTGAAEALAQKVVDVLRHPTPLPFPPRFSAPAMAHGVLDVYRALL